MSDRITIDLWLMADPAHGAGPTDIRLAGGLLQADEIAYAATLRHAWQRQQWCHRRSYLRQTLARYTGRAARDLALTRDGNGKPLLQDGPHFSVSHSRGQTVIAVSLEQPVGIDVEYLNPDMMANVAAYLRDFVPDLHLPADADAEAVLARWTQVEAVCKASGRGLTGNVLPLRSDDDQDRIIERHAADALAWSIATFPLTEELTCSVAAPAPAVLDLRLMPAASRIAA